MIHDTRYAMCGTRYMIYNLVDKMCDLVDKMHEHVSVGRIMYLVSCIMCHVHPHSGPYSSLLNLVVSNGTCAHVHVPEGSTDVRC